MSNSIHQFQLPALIGGVVDFSQYEGKKIMLVNVASHCGLTPQYQQLQDIYNKFSDKLIIIGCPANNFANQEPDEASEIQQFCQRNYGVTFPITAKISVKGDDMHPLYQFVTQQSQNGVQDSQVTWNFQKYIFDEAGVLTHVFKPQTEPADDSILAALGIAS